MKIASAEMIYNQHKHEIESSKTKEEENKTEYRTETSELIATKSERQFGIDHVSNTYLKSKGECDCPQLLIAKDEHHHE